MDLPIQAGMLNKVKHRHAIYLKFGERYFSSLAMLGLDVKGSICSTIKETLIVYCHNFLTFVVAVIN